MTPEQTAQIQGRDATARAFVQQAINGPGTVTTAENEQIEEVKAAAARAIEINALAERLATLREQQHAFIVKASDPPEGWRVLGPVLISEIAGISRQRITEIISREGEQSRLGD